ncbi:hypothetical protein [Shewanella subflava]|uniref:Solute-binding protein family 3/N-terminal domain-containing protein n=1 Tax=Shewanella subflava TaxID=2986476 RepID=A0ABT3I8B4_9GAMM|nr:hypothetical protein [Shewanella subflava]MCW3172301.1 hypothetical protein [Shewanella subflava]
MVKLFFRARCAYFVGVILLVCAPWVHATDHFIINHPESTKDARNQYAQELLQLVIDATQTDFGDATLTVADISMSRNRELKALEKGEMINIVAEASNVEWNNTLLPIYIPIRKGIQGFRLFIINQDNVPKLDSVKTLKQLMSLSTGSGSQWTTKVAMQQAGFEVVESVHYENLFNMLSKGRFVTFGRGVNEAYGEVGANQSFYPQLVVDKNLVLHIPLAIYFYVSPNTPRLADRIKVGLQRIIDNGQFDPFFYRYHCEYLLQSKLNQRLLFKINNPLVSEQQMTSIVGVDFLLNPKSDFAALCSQYQQ